MWHLGFMLLGFMPLSAAALDLTFGPDLKTAGWSSYTPRGKDTAEFQVDADGSLIVRADQAVAFLYFFVPAAEANAQTLSWDWRVDKSFPGTDLSQPGADDRALAVHVYFSDQNIGLMKRLGRGLAGVFGLPVSGRALTYVWGGKRPKGTVIPNPFMAAGEGVFIIRQSAEMVSPGQWVTEKIDLTADYKAAFGADPPPVNVIAVSADTDDTGASALALLRGLRLGGSLNGRH
jgi:hypothetical protein